MRDVAVDRAERPEEGRTKQDDDPQQGSIGRICTGQGRGNQQGNAPKTNHQANTTKQFRAHAARAQRFHGGHPERYGADDQRGNPGSHFLFRQRKQAIAAKQEQQADRRGAQPLAARRRRVTGQPPPDVQDGSGQQETRAGHQEGRDGFDGKVDDQGRCRPRKYRR